MAHISPLEQEWGFGGMMYRQCPRFRCGKRLVNSIDFSHDGKWIIIHTSDGIIKMLDIRSGECIAQIEGQDAFAGLTNGRWIAIAASMKVLDVRVHIRGTDPTGQLEFSGWQTSCSADFARRTGSES